MLKETWRLGYISAEAYQRATDVENIQGETLPTGRELNIGELTALMQVCSSDASPAGVRDAALIALLYSSGLRRDEAAKLIFEDFDQTNNRLVVRGKRNKQRYVYLAEGLLPLYPTGYTCEDSRLDHGFTQLIKKGRYFPEKSATKPSTIFS